MLQRIMDRKPTIITDAMNNWNKLPPYQDFIKVILEHDAHFQT